MGWSRYVSAAREGRGSGLSNLGKGTRGAIFFAPLDARTCFSAALRSSPDGEGLSSPTAIARVVTRSPRAAEKTAGPATATRTPQATREGPSLAACTCE